MRMFLSRSSIIFMLSDERILHDGLSVSGVRGNGGGYNETRGSYRIFSWGEM